MAYTRVWDATRPNGATTAANTIDSEIQYTRVDLSERIAGIFGLTLAQFAADPIAPISLTLSGNLTAATVTAALTGNASTATALANTRTIFGQNFNGTANVTGNLTTGANATITNAGGIMIIAPTTQLYIRSGAANIIYIGDNSVTPISLGLGGGLTTIGTLTVTGAATLQSHLSVSGYTAPVSGSSAEVFFSSGTAYFVGFNRTTALPIPVSIQGSVITLSGITATTGAITTNAATGDIVTPNAKGIRGVNGAGTDTFFMIGVDTANLVQVGSVGFTNPARFCQDTAANFSAGSSGLNGIIAIDTTNNRIVYYSNGARYYLAGTAF